MPVIAVRLHAVPRVRLRFLVFLTAFLLGAVASGAWSDARGPAWPVRTGLVLFGIGLVVSGLAPTFPVLLAGRALAGAGGGLLVVATYVVIASVFPGQLQPGSSPSSPQPGCCRRSSGRRWPAGSPSTSPGARSSCWCPR